MDYNDLIKKRRSIRKFQDKAVEKSKVDEIISAALLAPSGKRMFPCEFIVVDDKFILEKLSEAKTHGAKLIKGAPLAIVVAVDTNLYDVWVEDASVASTFIMLAAENCGLGCCWVQMHLRGTADGKMANENLKEILNLPDGYDILSVQAIGYKAEEKPAYKSEELKHEKVHYNSINTKK